MNVLHFIFARTGGVFQYIFSQLVIGDLAFLLFIAGIVILWRDKQSRNTQAEKPEINGRVLAILLMLPFALTCVAALLGKYPYGGTRHDALLIPFAIAGISVALVRICGSRPGRAVIAIILIVGLCNAFPAHHQPYISRSNQSRVQMDQAVTFIRTQVSPSEVIFSDFQSRLLLGHYLCDRKMVSYDKSMPDFISAECHGLRMIATTAKNFVFTPKTFVRSWEQLVVAVGLKPGEKVWIVQEGWNIRLPDQLKGLQEFHNLGVHSFGNNIAIFQLTVGQPLPNPDSVSD
jgi:hypothetical protein